MSKFTIELNEFYYAFQDAEKRDSIPEEEDLRKQLAEAQAELAAEKMKTIREGEKIDQKL